MPRAGWVFAAPITLIIHRWSSRLATPALCTTLYTQHSFSRRGPDLPPLLLLADALLYPERPSPENGAAQSCLEQANCLQLLTNARRHARHRARSSQFQL